MYDEETGKGIIFVGTRFDLAHVDRMQASPKAEGGSSRRGSQYGLANADEQTNRFRANCLARIVYTAATTPSSPPRTCGSAAV
jgi:hypothetical protein